MKSQFQVHVAYPWTPSHWQHVASCDSFEAAERIKDHWINSVAGMGVRIDVPVARKQPRKGARG